MNLCAEIEDAVKNALPTIFYDFNLRLRSLLNPEFNSEETNIHIRTFFSAIEPIKNIFFINEFYKFTSCIVLSMGDCVTAKILQIGY